MFSAKLVLQHGTLSLALLFQLYGSTLTLGFKLLALTLGSLLLLNHFSLFCSDSACCTHFGLSRFSFFLLTLDATMLFLGLPLALNAGFLLSPCSLSSLFFQLESLCATSLLCLYAVELNLAGKVELVLSLFVSFSLFLCGGQLSESCGVVVVHGVRIVIIQLSPSQCFSK